MNEWRAEDLLMKLLCGVNEYVYLRSLLKSGEVALWPQG